MEICAVSVASGAEDEAFAFPLERGLPVREEAASVFKSACISGDKGLNKVFNCRSSKGASAGNAGALCVANCRVNSGRSVGRSTSFKAGRMNEMVSGRAAKAKAISSISPSATARAACLNAASQSCFSKAARISAPGRDTADALRTAAKMCATDACVCGDICCSKSCKKASENCNIRRWSACGADKARDHWVTGAGAESPP